MNPAVENRWAPLYLAVLDRLREYVQRLGAHRRRLHLFERVVVRERVEIRGGGQVRGCRVPLEVERLGADPVEEGGRNRLRRRLVELLRYFVRIVEVEETLVRTSTNRASKGTSASR